MAIKPNLLLERCNDISDWSINGDYAVVDPAGQFKVYTDYDESGDFVVSIRRYFSEGITGNFTVQLKAYFDSVGAAGDNASSYLYVIASAVGEEPAGWQEYVHFGTDGLTLRNGNIPSVVKCNASAAWQEWRFEFNMSTYEVEVFLKEAGGSWASQGSFDINGETPIGPSANLLFGSRMREYEVTDGMCHLDYIYVGDGLGEIVANSGLFTFHG